MRPYNNYRNPELSQPVSSVENTLTDRASNSNASFDLLRSLSESISVDCGSFDISAPTEYCQTSSAPSQVAFVDPRGKEIRTPVESAPAAPVKSKPAKVMQTPVESSVNAISDMDDDNYDCMNDPNYRTQNVKESNSPSFEELLARTAESIAQMREETGSAISNSEASQKERETTNENKCNTIRTESRSDVKPTQPAPSPKKRWINWEKTRKALFSRETFKLVFLSVAISALIVSAVIYKKNTRSNGLQESGDVVMTQSVSKIQSAPVQGNGTTENTENKASNNGNYWGQSENEWSDPVVSNRKTMTDSFQDDYQSPTFDANQYSQNESDGYLNQEDAGRQLASPHSSNNNNNNNNQFVDAMPTFSAGPQYAEVSPALGAQYSPDEYESPVLEDDSISGGYSETGYNSNFMR